MPGYNRTLRADGHQKCMVNLFQRTLAFFELPAVWYGPGVGFTMEFQTCFHGRKHEKTYKTVKYTNSPLKLKSKKVTVVQKTFDIEFSHSEEKTGGEFVNHKKKNNAYKSREKRNMRTV